MGNSELNALCREPSFQGSSTKPVPARLLSKQNDPNGRFSRFEFALFPLERLAYDTKYRAQISYNWLYFVPMDGHDTLSDILFPEDIDIAFIDNNTLRLSPLGAKSDDFTLKSGRRTLHVKVVDP